MARHFCSRCSCLLWLRCHSGRLLLNPLPTTKPLQSTSPLDPSGVSVSSSLSSAHHQADSKPVQLSSLGDSRSSQAAFAALTAHQNKVETDGIPNIALTYSALHLSGKGSPDIKADTLEPFG